MVRGISVLTSSHVVVAMVVAVGEGQGERLKTVASVQRSVTQTLAFTFSNAFASEACPARAPPRFFFVTVRADAPKSTSTAVAAVTTELKPIGNVLREIAVTNSP